MVKILNVFISVLVFRIVSILRDGRSWAVFISPVYTSKFPHGIFLELVELNYNTIKMVFLACNTRCLFFFFFKQAALHSHFDKAFWSSFTKQPWHHDDLGVWENLYVVKRGFFSSVTLKCFVVCSELTEKKCHCISLSSEH